MIVDAHQHFWSLERGDYGWLTPALGPIHRDFGPADLKPELDAHGIARTVLVQAAATEAETDFLLGIADRTPWVAGVVGWIDFDAPDAPDRIAALADRPDAVGVRPMIQDLEDIDWMLAPRLTPVFDALANTRLAFDALVLPRHLDNLLTLLDRHPDLRTVVDHGSKPPIAAGARQPWAGAIARIAKETGASVKMSGLVTEAGDDISAAALTPWLDHLFESFGPARVLWGSDWPVILLKASYAEWRETSLRYLAHLSESDRAAVLGGNAAAFYRLEP